MSKRPLSPTLDLSSSSCSFPQSKQQCPSRFQQLHGLPASLLSTVCSFLSIYQTVSILRSTCQALHGSVTAECFLQSHLFIRSQLLLSLAASTAGTRALVSRLPCLSVLYRWEWMNFCTQTVMLPLQELRSPLDASRMLFSSLQSLHVVIESLVHAMPQPLGQSSLLSLMQLLAAEPGSFSSLRRLHIEDQNMSPATDAELAMACLPQARLPALTHCGLYLKTSTASSCSSLLSALSSWQSLTCLDLRQNSDACPHLLRLLCADAATPLLLRLQTLLLPQGTGGMDELYDTFLCKLSSLPAPSALQHLMGLSLAKLRAAGLLSVLSLPHLRLLSLGGCVRCSELRAVISCLPSSPAPLASLVFPEVLDDPGDFDYEHPQAAAEAATAAKISAARALLSRFPALRRLRCAAGIASAAVASPDSLPSDTERGCSGSLYGLTVTSDDWTLGFGFRFLFTAPLSFPLLTELTVSQAMKDSELELLLSACPQLLRLDCTVSQSWAVVAIAARCCPLLLDLVVRSEPLQPYARKAAAASQPNVSRAFLPQLVSLALFGAPPEAKRFVHDFSVLQHFAAAGQSQLRHVRLAARGLTAQHVLSLAALPRLSYLLASCYVEDHDRQIAAVSEAGSRTWPLLWGRDEGDRHRSLACSHDWEGSVDEPPPGPQQQHEMRQRVLEEAADWPAFHNVLDRGRGLEVDRVRAVFFAELRSVLSEAGTLTSRVAGTKGRV